MRNAPNPTLKADLNKQQIPASNLMERRFYENESLSIFRSDGDGQPDGGFAGRMYFAERRAGLHRHGSISRGCQRSRPRCNNQPRESGHRRIDWSGSRGDNGWSHWPFHGPSGQNSGLRCLCASGTTGGKCRTSPRSRVCLAEWVLGLERQRLGLGKRTLGLPATPARGMGSTGLGACTKRLVLAIRVLAMSNILWARR